MHEIGLLLAAMDNCFGLFWPYQRGIVWDPPLESDGGEPKKNSCIRKSLL